MRGYHLAPVIVENSKVKLETLFDVCICVSILYIWRRIFDFTFAAAIRIIYIHNNTLVATPNKRI